MFSQPTQAIRRLQHARSFFTLSILLALCAMTTMTASAQSEAIDSDPSQAIGNRFTARNTLQGNVTLPNGQRINQRVRVRISGSLGGDLFTMTDDFGAFIFRRLAGGSYYLTVDAGPEFERAVETVDIFDSGRGRGTTQTVQIRLHPKGSDTPQRKPAVVNAALAGVPKEALELYKDALKAAHDGDSKKAVEKLKNSLELHPTFVLALNELGVQYMKLNDFEKAGEAFRSAYKLAPDQLIPLLNYGILLWRNQQYADSEEVLRRLLVKHDNSAAAHYWRGRCLIALRKLPEAEKELLRAVELGGADVKEAHRFLGGIYREMGNNASAVASLKKYLELEPGTKDADSIRKIIAELSTTSTSQK
ncbi:MAG TPA: tetratricopeptide repeat protein [Pyrinomonadaceae bacterium]|nr:tetratricopeptide repeat protein [Pyrinomonadaceae bacterium]